MRGRKPKLSSPEVSCLPHLGDGSGRALVLPWSTYLTYPGTKLETAETAKERLQCIGLSPTRTDAASTILGNAYGGIGVKDFVARRG